MFKVGLEDYTVYGKHGAYQAEHAYEQPFIVSIWVELVNNQFSDELSKTINYADLQNVAHNVIANSPPIKLMETMISKMFGKSLKINLSARYQFEFRSQKPNSLIKVGSQ